MITKLLQKQMFKSPSYVPVIVETRSDMFDDIFDKVFELKKVGSFMDLWDSVKLKMDIPYTEHRIRRWSLFNTIANVDTINKINALQGVVSVGYDRRMRGWGIFKDGYEKLKGRYEELKSKYKPPQIAPPPEPNWVPTGKIRELLGINQAEAEGFSGNGVKVAVLDTGVQASHKQLRDQDITVKYATVERRDDAGHGCMVIIIIVGKEVVRNGAVIKGIAPDCSVLSVKVLQTPFGIGFLTDIIQGLEEARKWGAHIINLSLGSEVIDPEGADVKVIRDLANQGIIINCAVGNSGPEPSTVNSPANMKEVLAVGAIGTDGVIADYSSHGPCPIDINVKKPDYVSYGGSNSMTPNEYIYSGTSHFSMMDVMDKYPNGYGNSMGSSFSCPNGSGMIILGLEAGLIRTTQDIRNKFKRSPDNVYGRGLLDWKTLKGGN